MRYFIALKYYVFRIFFSERTKFFFWRIFSFPFGSKWIAIYGDKNICVDPRDIRAFRIARKKGSQKESIGIWRQMAAFHPEATIDIGANYGEFVVALSDFTTRVFAIEANPHIVKFLERTSKQLPHTSVHAVAIADVDGEREFSFNPYESGSASLVGAEEGNIRKKHNRLRVPVRTLDSFIQEHLGRFPRSFILKIDVEGFEEQVLQGARHMMAHADWWYIILEFNPSAMRNAGNSPARLWEKISSFPAFVIERNNFNINLRTSFSALVSMPPLDTQSDIVISYFQNNIHKDKN